MISSEEIIKDVAWVMHPVLDEKDCLHVMSQAKAKCIDNAEAKGDRRHRNAACIHFFDEDLADRLWGRIKDQVPSEAVIDSKNANLGLKEICATPKCHGTWRPFGVNSRFLVSRYDEGGHFGPHRDAFTSLDENHISLMTVAGYLVDRPKGYGGATRFVRDDLNLYQRPEDGKFVTPKKDVICRVEADRAGKAVLFYHDVMHDGEELLPGSPPKWFFRTDVLYARDPNSIPLQTEQQKKAQTLLKQAEDAEMCSDFSSAIKLYNQAYKLDPSLENSPT